MKIKIINKSKHKLPEYATSGAAGFDVRANIEENILLSPMQRVLVSTGLFFEIPVGYEAQIRPRSGLAFKNGVTVLNSPGTLDSDYRGEAKILLINLSDSAFMIKDGERIAQVVISKHEQAEWIQVEELVDTERGNGGFGSTGKV